MAYPVREVVPVVTTGAVAVGTTEAAVLILSDVSTAGPGARLVLHGEVNITAGTAATAVTVRVREGTDATGLEVGSAVVNTVAAGDTYTIPIDVVLNNVDLAGSSFVLTAQETAATANATIEYAFLGGYTA